MLDQIKQFLFQEIKALQRWTYSLFRWLAEPRIFWLTTLVLFLAVGGAAWQGGEAAHRIAGLVLQLLGIATVVWEIRQTRTLFGRPSILGLAYNWLIQFPRYRPKVISGTATVHGGGVGLRARGGGWSNAGSGATVEKRIDTLEKNVERLRKQLGETEQELRKQIKAQASALNEEKETRAKEDKAIRDVLEDTETGGLRVSLMGVIWVLVGIIMSTIPSELSQLLTH